MTGVDERTQAAEGFARVDMHCHSSASQHSRLGVQRAAGLPECATAPQEVYELAKRRGMDFVTITDHDTIAGVLEIAQRPDVFISEELTAHFRGEPQAVHVLCYGISPDDHEWLQAHRGDLELCAAYVYEHDIVCALAHPYYRVAAPLTPRHRKRLAQLFGVWEVRNGSRARELNRPAAIYIGARDGIGVGGSDDHAGIDIGRTWTTAPGARTPSEFLRCVREGSVSTGGSQGSAAKWAHSAIALAARSLGGTRGDSDPDRTAPPDPASVLAMIQRLLQEGDARHGDGDGVEITPADARRLLRAWMRAVDLDHLDEAGLIAYMQDQSFSHSELYRRACRSHELKLRLAVGDALAAARGEGELLPAAMKLFESCTAAIPYAPASAFLANEKAQLDARREDGEVPRVAILADGIGNTHGVTRVIEEIRRRGVPGFEIEVVGTDADVDRRLPAVAEIEVPHYPGLQIGVPSVPAAMQTLADGAFDLVHVCSPGPIGVAGAFVARGLRLPLVGSYHTELTTYAKLRSGDQRTADLMSAGMSAFYGACDVVLSPSPAADANLAKIGVSADRVRRWDRGVDTTRFSPALRGQAMLGDGIHALYAGRITHEKGADLLVDAFLWARVHEPRLRLVLAGGGPECEHVRTRIGDGAVFLDWLDGIELARAYAGADMFVFPSSTDTFGQVILEAQASGLPVAAVAAGGPLSLIEHGVSGLLCDADPASLGAAMLALARAPRLRERLARGGLASVRRRTWERALERLAGGYRNALTPIEPAGTSRAA